MSPPCTDSVAKAVASLTAFKTTLPPSSDNKAPPSHKPNAGQAVSHGPAHSPFLPDELYEMTNVFCLFMFTCLNPSHIKACFCIAHAGLDPAVYISTNQATFGENEDGLYRCADRINEICRLLSNITEDNALNTRNEILSIAIHDNWCKVGSRFGLHVSAALVECTNFSKDVKLGTYFPDKLKDMADRIALKATNEDNKYTELVKDMRQLSRTLEGIFELNAPPDYVCQVRKTGRLIPKGDKVTQEGKLRAVLAIYDFHEAHGDDLWAIIDRGSLGSGSGTPAECKQKFRGICQYVKGATFLCNLVLRHNEAGSSAGATTTDTAGTARSWFRDVGVHCFQLPEEAFLVDGAPPTKETKTTATPSTAQQRPRVRGANSLQDSTPNKSLLYARSTSGNCESTAKAKHALQTQGTRTPNLNDVIKELGKRAQGHYATLLAREKNGQRKKIITARQAFATAYPNSLGLGENPLPKIHAEISLLVAAEMLQAELVDRNINIRLPKIYFGSFKKSCYCCDLFMRATRFPIVTCQCHNKVYPSWRLPDHLFLKSLSQRGDCNSANWYNEFLAETSATLNAAVEGASRFSGRTGAAEDNSEDIQLQTFTTISEEAYSCKNWLGPSDTTEQALPQLPTKRLLILTSTSRTGDFSHTKTARQATDVRPTQNTYHTPSRPQPKPPNPTLSTNVGAAKSQQQRQHPQSNCTQHMAQNSPKHWNQHCGRDQPPRRSPYPRISPDRAHNDEFAPTDSNQKRHADAINTGHPSSGNKRARGPSSGANASGSRRH